MSAYFVAECGDVDEVRLQCDQVAEGERELAAEHGAEVSVAVGEGGHFGDVGEGELLSSRLGSDVECHEVLGPGGLVGQVLLDGGASGRGIPLNPSPAELLGVRQPAPGLTSRGRRGGSAAIRGWGGLREGHASSFLSR